MIQKILYIILGLILVSIIACFSFERLMFERVDDVNSASKPISHELWNRILSKFVDEAGNFDYSGLKADDSEFEMYIELLSANHPNDQSWTDTEQISYWINAYNAYTIRLILAHYPVSGIKKIKSGIPFVNSVWDIKNIHIEGKTYDLNNIEHSILRKKFDEPRIHFVINCASVSCPRISNVAYQADQLEKQLQEASLSFINDPMRNSITANTIEISKIFNWFKSDFTRSSTLIEFLNRYSKIKIQDSATISYKKYDWNLNDSI